MAYTLASLTANIQRRVDSATTADADVVAAKCGQVIDEIVSAFAPLHPSFLRSTDTFDTVAGQRAYAASALSGGDTIDGAQGIIRIRPPSGYDVNGRGRLLKKSQQELLDYYPDTTVTGTAQYWASVGATEAGVESWWLAPTPGAVLTYTMDFYKRATIPEDSGDSIALPQDVVRVIEQGAVAYFKDERGDVDADIALALFKGVPQEDGKGGMVGQILQRYFPEYEAPAMLQHEPIYYGQRYSSKGFC